MFVVELDFGDQTFDSKLFGAQDLSVKCVIELDDRFHAFKNLSPKVPYEPLCNDVGSGLLEVPARCGYPEQELKQYLSLYLDIYDN